MGIEDMQIYVVNLGKYTEGEETGAWFNVPVNMEELKEKLGLNEEYEEYAIHDYDLPFEISEHEPIEEINRRCRMLESVPENMLGDLKDIQDVFFISFDEMMESLENIHFYEGLENMTDLARYLIEECELWGEIPEKFKFYINYEAIGRDLDIDGFYLVTSRGIYEYIC